MKKFITLTAIAFTATMSAVAPAMAGVEMKAPATGTTAAAVSIKFNDNCNCNSGNSFSQTTITNNANNGLKELSSAVATGPAGAKANSSTNNEGTKASAQGYDSSIAVVDAKNTSWTKSKDGAETKSTSDIEYTGSAQGMNYIPNVTSGTGKDGTGGAVITTP
jgi:hypothetical protein